MSVRCQQPGNVEAARLQHDQAEEQRLQALASAIAEHEHMVTEKQAKATAQNVATEARQAAFASGNPEAVEWFVSHVLDGSRYPGRLLADTRWLTGQKTVTW